MTTGKKLVFPQTASIATLCAFAVALAEGQSPRPPMDVARVLAARYPAAPIMSYIPALSWSGALRVTRLTKDPQYAEKARREMQPFIAGDKPAIAEPYLLTSLAGHLALADLAVMDGNLAAAARVKAAADFILPDAKTGSGVINETATSSPPSPGQSADLANIVRFSRQ